MGRKPHPLIAEFFIRGQKLEDASNRYRHTCKACHQEFPKGRVDALTNHLVKCVALAPDDHNRVLSELSEKSNADGTPNRFARELLQQDSNNVFAGSGSMPDESSDQYFFGLDDDNPRKRKRGYGRHINLAQKQYESTFQLHPTGLIPSPRHPQPPMQRPPPLSTPGDQLRTPKAVSQDRTNEVEMLKGIQRFTEASKASQAGQHEGYQSAEVAPDGGLSSQQLALAASEATHMLPDMDAMAEEDVNDQQKDAQPVEHDDTQAVSAIDPLLGGDQLAPDIKPSSPPRQELVFHHVRPGLNPNQPHTLFMHDFSLNPDGSRSRVRNKFTEDRRREVREVRKQGACIRCRMLKKPCSEENPCSTCNNVDAARLWTGKCMRARIADEFDLLRDNMHLLIVLAEYKVIEDSCLFDGSEGVIEATQFPDEQLAPAIFQSTHRQTLTTVSGDQSSPLTTTASDEPIHIESLQMNSNNVGENLAVYLREAEQLYCERESSVFMRETMLMALETLDKKADPLLRDAVAMWVTVKSLVDPQLDWHLRSVASGDAANGDASTRSVDLSPEKYALTHRLITRQLWEFLEKRAFSLCRTVMHDFEKRLIQRQKVHQQHFETFLTAIILMNCIERICWLFNTWALKEDHANELSLAGLEGSSETKRSIATHRGVWPSQKSPRGFVNKGERVADIIAMLMKMRELPPPMAVDGDKYLVPDLTKKPSKGVKAAGDAPRHKEDVKTRNEGTNNLVGLEELFQNPRTGTKRGQDLQSNDGRQEDTVMFDTADAQDDDASFEERQAALIAQLHKDLSSRIFQDQAGDATVTYDESITNQAAEPEQDVAGVDEPRSDRERDVDMRDSGDDILPPSPAPGTYDALPKGTCEKQEAISPTLADDQEDADQNAEADMRYDPHSPGSARSSESPENDDHEEPQENDVPADPKDIPSLEAIMEDPLMAHLRQAAAEAAQGPNQDRDNDTRDDDEDKDTQKTPLVVTWFERVKLRADDLLRAKDGLSWDDQDCHCWELKYISRMLLPDIPGS